MNEGYYVMEKAKRYLELQAAFGRAFEKINTVLLSYPSAGIRVEEVNSISKSANVLGHECTFEFGAVDAARVWSGL